MTLDPRIRKALPYLALIAVVVGFINFSWFFAEGTTLGGDGLNGYASNGHYFVSNHGRYTEVSEAAWTWSRIHGVSIFITHPLLMAGGAYLLFRYIFPIAMVGRVSRGATTDRAQQIRMSGPALTTSRTAGRIGLVTFSGPLLDVSVYPGGIVMKPVFMGRHAILASEIREVTAKRGVFGQRVEVAHTGVDSPSPFVIFGSDKSPLVEAIRRVASGAPIAPFVGGTMGSIPTLSG